MFDYIKKFKFEIALLFLIACGLFLNPYHFAVSDHTYKIPFLKAEYHSGLYAQDITVSMRHYYASYLGVLIRPIVKIFGFEVVFFIIFCITQILFFLSVYLLATAIFREKTIGLMSVVLLWFPKKVLGGIATFDPIVEERTLAAVLLLLGIYFLISNRRLWASGLLALAANIHSISFLNLGLFVAVAFSIKLFLERDKVRLVKATLPFCLLLFAGILPIVLRSTLGSLPRDPLAIVDPVWLRMILVRSSGHFSPPYAEFFSFLSQAVAGLPLLFFFQRAAEGNGRMGLILYGASVLTMVFGFTLGLVFVTQCPILIGLQCLFFRASYMFVILSPMVWAYLFYETVRKCGRTFYVIGGLLFIFGAVLIPMAQHYHGRQIDNPFKPAMNENIAAQLWLKEHTEPQALLLTPPFPPSEFRIYSERSTLGSWKDWTYNCMNREFAFSMYERLQDTAGISLNEPGRNCPASMRRYYGSLSENDLIRIANKYKIDYIVMEDKRARDLEKVYENKKYVIYRPVLKAALLNTSISR